MLTLRYGKATTWKNMLPIMVNFGELSLNLKSVNTYDNFEHQDVVAIRWRKKKRTEGKQIIMRNPSKALTNLIFTDIRH